jgi:hypothetical protein
MIIERRPLDSFTHQYLETALWACGLDTLLVSDVPQELRQEAIADCDGFRQLAAADLEGLDEQQCAHDFYLTRERHGAGFWDRGLGAVGKRLTDAAHSYGSWDAFTAWAMGRAEAEGGAA